VRVAIVGSGPTGIYCADALLRLLPQARIDIFERAPQAFGLLRCAVAPDHLATKNLLRVFERVLNKENVSLRPGVVVGEDVAVADLEREYDALIIAAGAQSGRRIDIERAPTAAAITALDFACAFNGCAVPERLPRPRPIRHVCIVGSGNASLDVARLLMSPTEELRRFGVPEPVLAWHAGLALSDIRLIARGTPDSAKFSPNELAALENCAGFRPVVIATAGYSQDTPLGQLLARWQREPVGEERPLQLCFGLKPIRQGEDAIVCEDAAGRQHEFACDLLVEAIGQMPAQVRGLPTDPASGAILHRKGRVEERRATFVAGWSAGHQFNMASMREQAKHTAASVQKLLEHPDLV
jgi:ferredoxin--NADP+ reductase